MLWKPVSCDSPGKFWARQTLRNEELAYYYHLKVARAVWFNFFFYMDPEKKEEDLDKSEKL